MQAVKEFHESIIDGLTPGNKRALADYWRVSSEQDAIVSERVLHLVMQHPDYVAIVPSADETKQREDNKNNVRQALNEGNWGPLVKWWSSSDSRLAITAVSLESWYEFFSTSREVLMPALYEAYGSQPAKYQEAIKAMDLYFDISHLVISRSYVLVKEESLRKEEQERKKLELHLMQSDKLAVAGRLAASVAHEVNNPLESIKNAIHVALSDTPTDSKAHKFLELAENETKRVGAIVHRMTTLYKTETVKVPIDVNQLVRDALLLLKPDLDRHGIKTQTNLAPLLSNVLAVKGQLQQVFLNLLLNAKDAMPKGGRLRITTGNSTHDDTDSFAAEHVVIDVSDTGYGISNENMQNLFQPFFTTKKGGDNMGIGLWVTQNIVQSFGGQIKVRSTLGEGTTFAISLPILETI